jgi:UDP-glucose 4-epimerase
MDLAQAHLLSLQYMKKNRGFSAFNLGNGDGFSVLEVIKCCEDVVNNEIRYQIVERRDGDSAALVADNKLGLSQLNWNPKYSDINVIVKSAWSWHNSVRC